MQKNAPLYGLLLYNIMYLGRHLRCTRYPVSIIKTDTALFCLRQNFMTLA